MPNIKDLGDHLFAQLDRLAKADLTAEQIESEVKRTDAIVSLSDQIVRQADLQLKAVTVLALHGDRFKPHLARITSSDVDKPDHKQDQLS